MQGARVFGGFCSALLVLCLASSALFAADEQIISIAKPLSGENKRDFEKIYLPILTGQAYPVNLRRTVAISLLEHNWVQGISEMVAVLEDNGDPQGQLAVAEALAEGLAKLDSRPAAFVEPLFTALSAKDENLRQAAALAIANYNSQVLQRLNDIILEPDPINSEAMRLAAVTAVERIKDKKSVQILIGALDDENPQLSARCRQGLEQLVGISFEDDNAAWRQWWQQNKDKDLAEWRLLHLTALMDQNGELRKEIKQLSDQLRSQIEIRWRNAQDQAGLLDELLGNPLDDVRLQALYLSKDLLSGAFPAQLRNKIRQAITDTSAPVRALAAELLRDLRDKQSATILLEQLAQESEPKVRASFADALGYVGGAEAVQPLIDLLADPDPVVVGKAASALGNLASSEDVGLLKASIVEVLSERYEKTIPTNGADAGIRGKILSAMVEVGSPSFGPVFIEALEDSSALSRVAAVEGLRSLPLNGRRKKTLAAIRRLLDDPDRGVRLEVLRALDDLADVGELSNLEKRLDPNAEPDADVREAVWGVIANLLGKSDLDILNSWEKKTAAGNHAERHQQVLEKLAIKLAQARTPSIRLVEVREQLGNRLEDLKRWEAASLEYRSAYEQTKTISTSGISEIRGRLALKLLNVLLQQGAFDQVLAHLKDIGTVASPLEKEALGFTLDYLQTLLDAPSVSKNIDVAVELISVLESAQLSSLSQPPLVHRLGRLKTRAVSLRHESDKALVLMNLSRIIEDGDNAEVRTEASSAIGKLGLRRSAKHLLDELDRLLSTADPDQVREKALVDLLGGLDEAFRDYDLQADLDQRRTVLAHWQGVLQGIGNYR